MKPIRSCCSRETCCGMRVETAGFIFAIINFIIVTGATLCTIGFLGWVLSIRLNPEKWRVLEPQSIFSLIIIISSVSFVGAAIAEVFAVLLCVGISKKRPRYVMAYLVYGIINEIVSVIGIICFMWKVWGQRDLAYHGIGPLGFCVIYAVLLLLVKQTYTVLSDDQMQGHRKSINNNQCDV